MALNIPNGAFKLSAEDMGSTDYAGNLMKGMQAYYQPQMVRAQIAELQSKSMKNQMLANLLGSATGGMSGGDSQGGASSGMSPLGKAVLKGLYGIDITGQENARSPEQVADIQLNRGSRLAANRSNLKTGSSDVARESLQGKVSLPKEYMGFLGSAQVLKDRIAASRGDAGAKERLIQAGVASRLVPEYAGFQLQSQGQQGTVPALEHQRSAIMQGWPHALHKTVNNLTSEMQKEVERRHNLAIRDVNRSRSSFLAGGGRRAADVSQGVDNMGNATVGSFEKADNNRDLGFDLSHIQDIAKKRKMSVSDVLNHIARKENISVDELMQRLGGEEK